VFASTSELTRLVRDLAVDVLVILLPREAIDVHPLEAERFVQCASMSATSPSKVMVR
jgi:hypothetical protein